MPLRRCVVRCCLDKSDRIGIKTCYVFHFAAVSSSDIFGTAVSIVIYWSIAPKLSRQIFFARKIETAVPKLYPKMTQRRSETHGTSLCQSDYIMIRLVLLAISFLQYDLICPDSNFLHIGVVKQLARLYALRYDLSYYC